MGDLTSPEAKVQNLQTALHAKAKAEPKFRFYQLYDKVYRQDVLAIAYQRCKSNGGVAGVDGQTFKDIAAYGEERWLGELAERLKGDDLARVVHVRGDNDAVYGEVVKVMDKLASNGITHIAIMTNSRKQADGAAAPAPDATTSGAAASSAAPASVPPAAAAPVSPAPAAVAAPPTGGNK